VSAPFEVSPGLFVGDEATCRTGTARAAVVHACKFPCHARAVGYRAKDKIAEHPEYLAAIRGDDLYLNLIDPPVPLFKPASFHTFLGWMMGRRPDQAVLIHCNRGESRAPSLAMLWMATQGLLPRDSYVLAGGVFLTTHYPRYEPGEGIRTFLEQHWTALMPAKVPA